MEDNKRSTLEALNEQFRRQQEIDSVHKVIEDKKEPLDRKQKVMLIRIVLLVLIILAICLILIWPHIFDKPQKSKDAVQKQPSESLKQYSAILTEQEKKRWKEETGEENELFVEVNTEIPVEYSSLEATLHLINPPYSKHDFEIEIYVSGQPDKVLYQSERIVPGTVVETVTLLEPLEVDTYPVSICYSFYKGEETIGLHVVAAELLVQDKK